MSYNPARAAGRTKKKVRRYDPHAGVKHSDIVKKQGLGFSAPSMDRTKTLHGFSSEVFSCDSFTQRYSCLLAGNNTGLGYTNKGNRTVMVVQGVLYVTFLKKVKHTDSEGTISYKEVADIQEFGSGLTVNFPAGTRYSMASSGTANVELVITETTDYEKGWKEIGNSTVTTTESITVVPPKSAAPTRRPRSESKAYQQAQQQSAGTRKTSVVAENNKRTSHDNVNSSAVIGVNPRPSGPPRDD